MTDESDLLGDFSERVVSGELPVYGIVIDRLHMDRVTHQYRSDDRVNIYSGAKTFTSVGVGIARDDGLLDLDDRVLDHFPAHRHIAAEGAEQITVQHLLTMTAGNEYTLFTEDQKRQDDVLEAFLSAPLVHQPGSRFEYSSGCSYVLGRLVEQVTGRSLRDFLEERLFTPLGIWNPLWGCDPRGHTWGGTDLHLQTAEYSLLPALLLRDGRWQGKSVVSSVWSDDPEGTGYGFHVWHCTPPGAYRGLGSNAAGSCVKDVGSSSRCPLVNLGGGSVGGRVGVSERSELAVGEFGGAELIAAEEVDVFVAEG